MIARQSWPERKRYGEREERARGGSRRRDVVVVMRMGLMKKEKFRDKDPIGVIRFQSLLSTYTTNNPPANTDSPASIKLIPDTELCTRAPELDPCAAAPVARCDAVVVAPDAAGEFGYGNVEFVVVSRYKFVPGQPWQVPIGSSFNDGLFWSAKSRVYPTAISTVCMYKSC